MVSFPQVPPPKPCIRLSSPPISATCPTHLIILDFITQTISGEISLSSSLCSFLHSPCHLVPLSPKYSPQHPILKHPKPTFFPQCERPSSIPIHNNRQNYSSVNLNLYSFWMANWKTKDLAIVNLIHLLNTPGAMMPSIDGN